MTRRIFCRVLLVVVAILGLFTLSSVLMAQGNSENAFERVREVQERHTDRLMAIDGVEGTAIGLNQNDQVAVKVFTARPGIGGIEKELDGVPVHVVVTGKIYALPKPEGKPEKPGKPPKDRTPPSAPTALTALAVSSSQIDLNWDPHPDPDSDLDHYNVYCSTTSGGPYSRIDSVIDSEYFDTGLMPDRTYYYVVTAVDTSRNESANSGEASANTNPELIESPIGPRPAPIGVSTGHPNITAGTIGCRVRDGEGKVYALSNNHVYADENKASIGDNVLQPGPYDGGENPRDAIGTLAEFEPINFHPRASNTIDAAIALSSTDDLGNATPSGGYGTPGSTTVSASINLGVQKYGRTTGQTSGVITAINAIVRVGYDSGTARFINQIVIEPGSFSAGGDSGSLIVTDDNNCNPVGLLFAGSSLYTIANPIDDVLSAFGVTIDGK